MIYRFINENKTIEYEIPVTILEAARELGIKLSSEICGIKKCGRCKVYLKNEDIVVKACEYIPKKNADIVTYNNVEKETKELVNNIKSARDNEKYYAITDVGTTNVELRVYAENSENILCDVIMENPLRQYGSDVMSLITFANTKDKLNILHKTLLNECEKLIHNYIFEEKIIIKAFTGNTTMLHILADKDVNSLGRSPFTINYWGGEFIDNKIYIAPIVKSHVGGDSLCCLYGIDEVFEGTNIILDIGTNSEIMLVKDDNVFACSAAAGPAFESSNISCGMKNEKGAVVKAYYEGEYYYDVEGIGSRISYRDYRCSLIKGISGSAILDIIALLHTNKRIDDNGNFTVGKESFSLSPHCKDVMVLVEDIRNVILGKAAIKSGIQILMKEAGIFNKDINRIFITGDFGEHIDIANAVKIGLFPDVSVDKFISIKNAALKGLYNIATDNNKRKEAKELAKKIKHIDLTAKEDFNDYFIKNMMIRKE